MTVTGEVVLRQHMFICTNTGWNVARLDLYGVKKIVSFQNWSLYMYRETVWVGAKKRVCLLLCLCALKCHKISFFTGGATPPQINLSEKLRGNMKPR